MLPHRHQVDFARRKGNVPYPCYYCMNYVQFPTMVTDEHNFVLNFGKEENVPCTCMGGMRGPSEKGDCKGIQILELQQYCTRWYPSNLFDRFTREYWMEMLTDIKCGQPIARSMLIARARKGYHTREQRINEMLEEGLITQSYNVNNEEMYTLTAYGEAIADEICHMLDAYQIIKEQGELLEYDIPMTMFEWIRSNPNSTAKQIYNAFSECRDSTFIETTLEDLVSVGYVEPLYDSDYEEIRFNTTQKGVDSWKMTSKRRQYIVADAEERSA